MHNFDCIDNMMDRYTTCLEDEKYCENTNPTMTELYDMYGDMDDLIEDLSMKNQDELEW